MPFSDQDIYEAVKNNLPKVSTYVNSHGGDIILLGTKDGIVYIELIGTCKGCAMSIMTTKMPDALYTVSEVDNRENKVGLIQKISNFFKVTR